MTWTQPQPREEFTTILLRRTDRYGYVSWHTDGTSRYFASINYTDDYRGDWGIQPPCSFAYIGDAKAWVEGKIDLPPSEADRQNQEEAGALMAWRKEEHEKNRG